MKKNNKKTFIPKNYIPKLKGDKLLPLTKINEVDIVNIKLTVSDFPITKNKFNKKFICIAVQDDNSQIMAIKKNVQDLDIEFLEYDFIGTKWDFYFLDKLLIFIVNNNHILPLGIYNRPFIPNTLNDKRYQHCVNFNLALQVWEGYKINCGIENYYNSSKPLQTSLIGKNLNQGCDNIIIPRSYVVKLNKFKAVKFLFGKRLIVKSCSGVRSKVEHDQKFNNWDFSCLNNIPTLFQECIIGKDIRVHVIKSKIYCVQIKEKQGIDYRYNKNSGYELIDLPASIKEFCFFLKKIEKLNLVGVDLIFNCQLNKYYILESNPNPGWAGFHRNSNQEENLARDVVNV